MFLAQGKAQDLLDRMPPDLLLGPARANLLVVRGHASEVSREFSFADRTFEEARVLDPRSVPAPPSLAELTAQKGFRTEALALVGRAAAEAPADRKVSHMKGVIVQRGGDRKVAIDTYSRALELQPGYADARVARPSLAIGSRDVAGAVRWISNASRASSPQSRAATI